MITNERQYLNTRAAAKRFEQTLKNLEESSNDLEPWAHQTMKAGIESELEVLRAQLTKYEAFRSGSVTEFAVDSFDELPDLLILARIARGLTQKDLAEELGIKEQQLQRYEATRYNKAAFERLLDVAVVLGLKVHVQASLAEDDSSSESTQTTASTPLPVPVQRAFRFFVQLRGGASKQDEVHSNLQPLTPQQFRIQSGVEMSEVFNDVA